MRAKLAVLLVLSPVASLNAQRLSETFWPAPPRHAELTVTLGRQNHAVEGTVVGALVLGAVGALVGNQTCQNNLSTDFDNGCRDEVLIGGLVGAAAGGVLGYFIGKGMPRSSGN